MLPCPNPESKPTTSQRPAARKQLVFFNLPSVTLKVGRSDSDPDSVN